MTHEDSDGLTQERNYRFRNNGRASISLLFKLRRSVMLKLGAANSIITPENEDGICYS